MAHKLQFRPTRIRADLVEQIRSMPMEQKSIIRKVEYLLRLGIRYVEDMGEQEEDKTDT